MLRTLASRLTVLYTLLFAILALVVFGVVNYSLKANLLNRIDQEFIGDGQEYVEIFHTGGLAAIAAEIRLETEGEGVELVFTRVFSPEHKIIATSDIHSWENLPEDPSKLKILGQPQFETRKLPGHSGLTRIFYQPLGEGYTLQSGVLLAPDERLLSSFQQVFMIAFSCMLLSGVVIGFYISKRALAGVQRVRETADQISRGNLTQPISFQGKTEEINNLINSINRMQERIHTLISELQDVTNNIAHDLRSPLTRIRGLAEMTLTGEQSIEDYRGMSGAVIEECDSLVSMINTMLEIAETDAGVKPLSKETLDIKAIISDVVELYSPVAEDKKIKVALKNGDSSLLISGDRSRLQRAFANLLDNALKFTQPGGRVALETKKQGERICVSIADSGSGISATDLPHICERFYRADRSRSTPGTGLGLSLVQSIILAHNGEMIITSEENAGTQVTIWLDVNSTITR